MTSRNFTTCFVVATVLATVECAKLTHVTWVNENKYGATATASLARGVLNQYSSITVRRHDAMLRQPDADSTPKETHKMQKEGSRFFLYDMTDQKGFGLLCAFMALFIVGTAICVQNAWDLCSKRSSKRRWAQNRTRLLGPAPDEDPFLQNCGDPTVPRAPPDMHDQVLKELLRSWLVGQGSWAAWGLVIMTLVFWIIREANFAFLSSMVQAEVVTSLSQLHETKDLKRVESAFYASLACGLFCDLPLYAVFDPWVRTWFVTSFRSHATSRVLAVYLNKNNQAYYRLKMKEHDNKIDNPDQRIADDLADIAGSIYDMYAASLSALFGSTMWSAVIVMLGGKVLLVVAVFASALRLAVSYGCFRARLTAALMRQQATGADLRYGLMRIRENAEGVALSGGADLERENTQGLYDNHIDATVSATRVQVFYGSVMSFIGQFPHLVLWICQLTMMMNGTLTVGDALRVHQGYDQFTKVLAFFVENFDTMMVLQACSARLGAVWTACIKEQPCPTLRSRLPDAAPDIESPPNFHAPEDVQSIDAATQSATGSRISFEVEEPNFAFSLLDVYVSDPCSTVKVGGASLSVERGSALLLTGSSGLGKTSVLRALAGLWLDGNGTVRRAPEAEVLFLPQQTYLPQATLLETVLYPLSVDTFLNGGMTGAELHDAMRGAMTRASLGGFLERYQMDDTVRDWQALLSPGERQRIGFARLFMRLSLEDCRTKSFIVVLDESTSAVEITLEAQLYTELRSLLKGGSEGLLAIASVGHRPTLPRFHDIELRIGASSHCDEPEQATRVEERVISRGTWVAPDTSLLPWTLISLTPAKASSSNATSPRSSK